MEATVNPIRSGRSRYCEVHSHQQLNRFHNDVLWENVFLVRGADHDVQELGDVVCEFTQIGETRTLLKCFRVILSLNLTLTQTAAILVTICLLDCLDSCPNPSSIQNLDGMEEVFKRQQLVANCLAHEDKHCLTVHRFRDFQGHDARRQLHHVELLNSMSSM